MACWWLGAVLAAPTARQPTFAPRPPRPTPPRPTPPLPDYLQSLGCEVFVKGEYVKCEGCVYDGSGEGSNRKVTHEGSLSPEDALRIMTQSGIDVFSQMKISDSKTWEFHGINFDTKKTPIWDSKRFKKESLKCGKSDPWRSTSACARNTTAAYSSRRKVGMI